MNRFRAFARKLLKNTVGAETGEVVAVGAGLLLAASIVVPAAKDAITSTGGQIPGYITTAAAN